MGYTLARNCRGEDVPCRLRGEEFALLLPGASLELACQRAEELREEVRTLRVAHEKEFIRLADQAM